MPLWPPQTCLGVSPWLGKLAPALYAGRTSINGLPVAGRHKNLACRRFPEPGCLKSVAEASGGISRQKGQAELLPGPFRRVQSFCNWESCLPNWFELHKMGGAFCFHADFDAPKRPVSGCGMSLCGQNPGKTSRGAGLCRICTCKFVYFAQPRGEHQKLHKPEQPLKQLAHPMHKAGGRDGRKVLEPRSQAVGNPAVGNVRAPCFDRSATHFFGANCLKALLCFVFSPRRLGDGPSRQSAPPAQ
jgi:hypothetical protein